MEGKAELSREATSALLGRDHAEFDIFYGKYLSNHMAHGLIAVYGMGGTPQRLEEFYEAHSKHDVLGYQLEPARLPDITITAENWRAHLGEIDRFPEYYEFFVKELEQKGLRKCIDEYLDAFVKHTASHAFHPFIHLGFALFYASQRGDISDAIVVLAEGFAVSCVSDINAGCMHSGLPPESPMPAAGLLHCVAEIYVKPELDDVYSEEFAKGNFTDRMTVLKATIGPHVVAMVNQWYHDVKGKRSVTDEPVQRKLLQHIGRLAYAAHWGMHCKDFFLLHGVTAFFALVQTVKAARSFATIRDAILNFTYGLLMTYAEVGAPKLRPLSELRGPMPEWNEVLALVIPEGSEKNDEHMLKLVFVSRELEALFDSEEDRLLVRSTAKTGAELPFYTSSHYSFNEGLRQRGLQV